MNIHISINHLFQNLIINGNPNPDELKQQIKDALLEAVRGAQEEVSEKHIVINIEKLASEIQIKGINPDINII